MIDVDKWREIFDSLSKHKLRTALTAFSVWWGICMLVILMGAGTGMENSVIHDFRDDAMNSIFIRSGQTSESYKGLPAGRFIQFKNDDYKEISEMGSINHSTGRYFLGGEFFIKYKNESLSFNIRCVHPGHRYLENSIILEGRFLNDKDLDEYRKTCVIGTIVAEGFFGEESKENNYKDAIGKYLNIKGTEYQIVGVFTDEGGENERRTIYLPITTIQKIEGTDRVHMMMVELGDATLEESIKIEEAIKSKLALNHRVSPTDREAIRTFNVAERFQEIQTVFIFIKGFIWFVGIGSIIAGVIGVSNIMLIVVKERTKEIGVRKALGATPNSIVSMIVQEAILLTSISGYLGLACGLGVVAGVQTLMEQNNIEAEFFRDPEVNLPVVLTALVILILSGAVAGLIPALQAVRINPVEAMKG